MSDPETGGSGPLRGPRAYAGLGLELALPIVLLMYGGYRLDVWLDTGPWLMSVGAVLGVAVGFYSFFKRVLPSAEGSAGSPRPKSEDEERRR